MSGFCLRGRGARRARARGPPRHAARRGGDAGLHAGRHGRSGQGRPAPRPRRDRRADPAREHVPPDAAARATRSWPGSAASTASPAGRAPSSRTAAATRSSRSPRCASSTRRACASRATSTGRRTCCPPNARWRSSRTSGRTSRWPSTSARPETRPARPSPRRPPARPAGPGAAARRTAAPDQWLFGIVQGGVHLDLRETRAPGISSRSASPATRGGSLGGRAEAGARPRPRAPRPDPARGQAPATSWGWARPEDIVDAVARGIDMFDCVLPTRNARNGQLFTSRGRISIRNARFRDDPRPPDPDCRLPHLPDREPRLPAPPPPGGGDDGRDLDERPQPVLLP